MLYLRLMEAGRGGGEGGGRGQRELPASRGTFVVLVEARGFGVGVGGGEGGLMGRGAFFAEQTRLSQVAARAAPRSPGAPSMECDPTDLLDTSADVCEACRSGSTTHTTSRKQWKGGVGVGG